MSDGASTFGVVVAGVVGALVGAQWGIWGGVGGFFGGLVVGAAAAVGLDHASEKEHKRRTDDEDRARWKQEREQHKRAVARMEAAIEKARTERHEVVGNLVSTGVLDVDQARQVIAEGWPVKLLAELRGRSLTFADCVCVTSGEFQHGQCPAAVALMLGPPDREVKSELKTKTKVTWTYYEDAHSRKGVTFKGVFDDGKLVDFTALKDLRFTQMLDRAFLMHFGEVAATERVARMNLRSSRV